MWHRSHPPHTSRCHHPAGCLLLQVSAARRTGPWMRKLVSIPYGRIWEDHSLYTLYSVRGFFTRFQIINEICHFVIFVDSLIRTSNQQATVKPPLSHGEKSYGIQWLTFDYFDSTDYRYGWGLGHKIHISGEVFEKWSRGSHYDDFWSFFHPFSNYQWKFIDRSVCCKPAQPNRWWCLSIEPRQTAPAANHTPPCSLSSPKVVRLKSACFGRTTLLLPQRTDLRAVL